MGEPRVAQAGGQIERANDLGHANARTPGGAGVAIGHVGGSFFAMTVNSRDVSAPFHLGERAAQHGRYHEHMGHAIGLEHVRQNLRAGCFSHGELERRKRQALAPFCGFQRRGDDVLITSAAAQMTGEHFAHFLLRR